jgi:hypothetical protein
LPNRRISFEVDRNDVRGQARNLLFGYSGVDDMYIYLVLQRLSYSSVNLISNNLLAVSAFEFNYHTQHQNLINNLLANRVSDFNMLSHLSLLQLSLSYLTIAHALPSSTQSHALLSKKSEGIQWGPCTPDIVLARSVNITIYCANHTVPLDYTDLNSTATIDLELMKVPAVKAPSKNSILFNFGGPGETGRSNLASNMHTWIP